MLFKKLKKRTKTILVVQAIAMLMGGSTHILWVLEHGFLSDNYGGPIFTKLFWDSLTFFDPIAAALLILKPKVGIYLTLIIILVDVIHNNLFYFDELYLNPPDPLEWVKRYWMILGQIIFGVFVIITFKGNLREITLRK